ncbi:efflux RND transporter periplasmic adaptor subunit [Hyphococcus sp.]|uniref:efflux RND transporter periplasmic adaptor subunit n=1 Tax=Hyphococcus sp. TaxID=2038636 RepID=UPI003CCC3718
MVSKQLLAGLAAGAVIGAVIVAATLTGAGQGPEAAGGPGGGGPGGGRGGYAPVVSMTLAEEAAIQRTVEVIGRTRSLRSVAITSEVTGLVEELNFAPGQRVTEGDVLVQVDDDEAQVALARARAQFPIAQDNATRYRNLAEDEAASALEAEAAQNNFVSIRADLRAAEVAVAQRKIRAPFNGIAGLTEIEPGDYLRAGDLVATLDDTSSIVIEFSVPQESAGYVNIGQPVSVTLTSDLRTEYSGEITAIDSRVDPESRTLRVEARVDNERGRLIPGAVVAVSTTAEGEPAIAVPGLSVQWDRAGAYVWRRGEDGAAERAGVIILQRTEDMVLVEGDLQADDVIVSEGADRIRGSVPLPEYAAQRRDSATTSSVSAPGAFGGGD